MHGMGIASSGIERVIAFIAIAHNNSPKVRTENIHCRTIRSVAYLKNYDVGSAKAMKVAVDPLEPPASLVCMNDISIGNLQLQNGDQAFGFVRDILGRTDNTTWRKGKTESRLKEAGNFSKWHPERVFQFGSYCDGVWPQRQQHDQLYLVLASMRARDRQGDRTCDATRSVSCGTV